MAGETSGDLKLVKPEMADNVEDTIPALGENFEDLDTAVSAHLADDGNPHGVTPAQIGAATSGDLSTHIGDTENPHSVTQVQLGLGNVENIRQAPLVLAVNEQMGTSYSLVLSDGEGKIVDCDNANPFTLTIPANASVGFPVGTQILIRQKGAGQVTVTPADGVTLQSVGGADKSFEQHSVAGLVKLAEDTWLLCGDITDQEAAS